MPYLNVSNATLHFTDSQQWQKADSQETIITLHGLSESHLYWSLPGVADRLIQAGYRVVSLDMRGHGFSRVDGENKGYDVNTLVADVLALADHLDVPRFHFLTHATGGIVGFRFAMQHGDRLLSLLATNTGSATYPLDDYADIDDPDYRFPSLSEADKKRNRALMAGFQGRAWGDIAAYSRTHAARNPFLSQLPLLPDTEQAFALYTACSAIGNPENMADFIGGFFTDYDTQIKGLRTISCPTLMLVGEYDRLFIKPAERVAKEVPNCEHVVMKGIGHMTAIEDPDGLSDILLTFLKKRSDRV